MYHSGDDIGAIVADFGSYATKVGYAGDDSPKAYFQTAVGVSSSAGDDSRLMEVDSCSSSSGGEDRSGSGARYVFDIGTFREGMRIDSPIKDGLIVNWDMWEHLWEHTLASYLHNKHADLRESPVLIAEKPYNTVDSRRKMMELMFEKYQAPAAFTSKDLVLSCYACGKTSGLVVDMGGSGSVAAPVSDGWVESKALFSTPLGGRLVDSHVHCLFPDADFMPSFRLNRQAVEVPPDDLLLPGLAGGEAAAATMRPRVTKSKVLGCVHASYEAFMRLETARDVKEACSRMSDAFPDPDDPRYTNLPLLQYELPDGTQLEVGIQRFQVPELFIDPAPLSLTSTHLAHLFHMGGETSSPAHRDYTELLLKANGAGTEHHVPGVPQIVVQAIQHSEPDQQATLLNNMLLGGGSACVEGLPERLKSEVEALMFNSSSSAASGPTGIGLRTRLMSVAPPERALCAWLGGSILASLGGFHELWVSRQEYEEHGPTIVDKKCP